MTAESDKLNEILTRIKKDVDNLKNGSAAPQLAHSSVDINTGKGYIPFFSGDVEVMRIGRQPDGSVTTTSVNNTDPPYMPYDPQCTPGINSIQVFCTGFKNTQFLDFSHVNIYQDGAKVATLNKVPGSIVLAPLEARPYTIQLSSVNLSGTESPLTNAVIATPNLVVAADITNGIIDTLKLANSAVTEAKVAAGAVTNTKIGDNSIDSYKIAAYAIQAINIAALAISADKLAANSVTADKIQALAIAADKIAANAINAGHIQAGSVDASKLAAQIVMATLAFICGNPVGQRLVIDSTGLNQYDATGKLTSSFGANPNGGNFLTIPDSNGNVLASLDQSGILSVRGLNISDVELDSFQINGDSFYETLASIPRGIIARSYLTSYNQSTTSETGICELSVNVYAGRQYRVVTSGALLHPSANVPAELRLRVTSNGSRPLISNTPAIASSGRADHPYDPMNIDYTFYPTTDYTWYGLLTVATVASGTTGAVLLDNVGLNMWIEDIGKAVDITGGPTDGAGSNVNAKKQVKTYNANWTMSLMPFQSGSGSGYNTAYLIQGAFNAQGNDTQGFGYIGFPYQQIQSDLSGGVVNRVELFLYNNQTGQSTGTVCEIGTHGYANPPAPGATPQTGNPYGQAQTLFSGGSSRWIDIPQISTAPTANVNIWDQLKNGTRGGFCLDSGYRGHSDYSRAGVWYGVDSSVPVAAQPKLRITYTK